MPLLVESLDALQTLHELQMGLAPQNRHLSVSAILVSATAGAYWSDLGRI